MHALVIFLLRKVQKFLRLPANILDSCSSPLVPGCYLRDARSICCLFGVRVAPPSCHSFLGLAWWLVQKVRNVYFWTTCLRSTGNYWHEDVA